ncbi:MAG TPA: hypothetical protein VJO16_04730 [Candidatus Acidoferrum sp.]|nr:hypothetical protein [Candidatus Acidoferrum sp.]
MTEVQVLFLVFVAVYLLQCIGWAPIESEVFRIGWRLRARLLRKGSGMRFGRYKLFFLNPFLPLSGATICELFPSVRTSKEESPAPSTPSGHDETTDRRTILLSAQDKQQVQSAGKEVRSSGRVLFLARSEAYAYFLASILDRVRKRSIQDRHRALEREFEKIFDTKRIAVRLEEYQAQTVFLRTACVLLFVFLFFLAPVLIWLRGLERIWPFLLAYLIWSLAWIGWSFLRAHRALYPEQKEGRWQQVMVLALSPFSAIRANDILLRDLFCAFHTVAIGHVLLAKEETRVLAERNLRQSMFRSDGDATSSDTLMRRVLESFLIRIGMPPDELLSPPRRESQNCHTYCPLCLAQFVLAEGECPDCGDVPLRKFPPDAKFL